MGHERAMMGAVVGTAVGDALGLPREGLSPAKAARLYGDIEHRFWFGRGVVSDDTEHTVLVLQALSEHGEDVGAFRDDLARRLRWWLAGLPVGIGFGTLRALLKSWLGWGPHHSGVQSAGNGPAMRSAVIGVFSAVHGSEPDAWVDASTRITHTDPRAFEGALAVARCARLAVTEERVDAEGVIRLLRDTCQHASWDAFLSPMAEQLAAHASTSDFARHVGLGDGVSGYIVHSVPVAIYAWLRHPEDAEKALTEIVKAGGDSDSTAAITGALVGCRVGVQGIPQRWRDGLMDWPMNVDCLCSAAQSAVGKGRSPRTPMPLMLVRNVLVLPVVVAHVIRHWRPSLLAADQQ